MKYIEDKDLYFLGNLKSKDLDKTFERLFEELVK